MSIKSQAMALLTSQEKVEWYTPPEEIARARRVLGTIALDPASDAIGNRAVQATTYYDRGGLTRPWFGPVWCNPPYNGQAAEWVDRFIAQYAAGAIPAGGIMLVNSCPGYQWWERAWRACWSCLATERIPFLQADGEPLRDARGRPISHKKGSTFLYLGPKPWLFADVYRSIGRVLPPQAA